MGDPADFAIAVRRARRMSCILDDDQCVPIRQHTQLNLRIIRRHKYPARLRHKPTPDFLPQLGADGNVLEVRIVGGQPAGGRAGL